MSRLEFPGAIFVGIHDNGQSNGLTKHVRSSIPEDSIIVELDNAIAMGIGKCNEMHSSKMTNSCPY